MRERFAGVIAEPFELERRDDRWLALGAEVVAMLCDDPGRQAAEAWLLERWRAGGVPVPRVLVETDGIQVRERLHGVTGEGIHREAGSSSLFVELPTLAGRLVDAPLTPFGERVADSYGDLAARIRRAVDPAEARAMFRESDIRRFDLDAAIAAYLAADAPERTKAIAVRRRAWLADLPPVDALVHADLHFHNLCTAPDGTIAGLWDFGGVGLDAHATELHYAPSLGRQFVERAIAAYGPVDREAIDRAHLRTALDHVLYHGPDKPRHAHVVAWTTAVLDSLA